LAKARQIRVRAIFSYRAGILCGKAITAATVVCLLATTSAFCQISATTASSRHKQQAPLSMLYVFFLNYQSHLDQVADTLTKQGKNGSDFRSHFQRQLGFSDAEFASVRTAAAQLQTKLHDQDMRAKAIIDATRPNHPTRIKNAADLPPLPPELIVLQQERNGLIEREVAKLRASLGPKQAAKLDALIQNDFVRNVKIENVGPLTSHDNAHEPLPAFRPEGKP